MILIGSRAMRVRGVWVDRLADLDLIGTFADVEYLARGSAVSYPTSDSHYVIKRPDKLIIEVDIGWGEGTTNDRLLDETHGMESRFFSEIGCCVGIPSLDLLYAIKLSHRYKGGKHFLKTMRHILAMRAAGAQIDYYQAFLALREAETYGKHPKLNVSKDQFFDGAHGVQYVYDHDTIHEAVKHLDRPAYSYFKPTDSEVMVCRKMWAILPRQVQLYAVLEECYVLALERSQIPHPHVYPRRSFEIALEKVCTQITSGWFREFAWENYNAVMALYENDGACGYVERFREALAAGIVKKLGAAAVPVGLDANTHAPGPGALGTTAPCSDQGPSQRQPSYLYPEEAC